MPDTKRYCPNCGEACGWEDKFCTSCRAELRPTSSKPASAAAAAEPQPLDRFNSDVTELGLQPNSVLLNRYCIRKELGVGGMGRVYLADDQKLGLPVAIKVLRDVLQQDPGSVKRLISEAKTSIMLAHPNIVRLHNFEDSDAAKFLVMEYVEGESLGHLIAREGKLSEAETRRIGIEICKGLEHAHSKKVIHRDMKPGNVMLGKDGSIKIADFGIARLCRDSMSRLTSQQDSGTLLYMAPEQLDGESTELTDLYSLGVVLYEMLAGDPPFTTGEITAQIRYKAPRPIPEVSAEMSAVVFKCLEKKPQNRFAGMQALREALEGKIAPASQQAPEQTQQTSAPEASSSASQKNESTNKELEWKKWVDAIMAQANDLMGKGRLKEAENILLRSLQHDANNAAFNDLMGKIRGMLQQSGTQKQQPDGGKKKKLRLILAVIGILFIIGMIYNALENNEPKPPMPPAIDLAGDWDLTITLPDGRSVQGRLQVSGLAQQLHLVETAAYSALGADGLWHQFREENYFDGSLIGLNVAAQCLRGALTIDGYQAPPQGYPIRINLLVTPDGQSMQGQGASNAGAFALLAHKQ